MHEYIIENLSDEEIKKLEKSNIKWIIDDITTSDVCVFGAQKDAFKALEIIGRTD